MGWMHDSLSYIQHEAIHRQYHHHEMTFSMMYAYSERFILPISHDEVVHGKGSLSTRMPGDRWQQLANVRTYLSYMWAHPGKKLLFMGSEFAQSDEWASERGLDWHLLQFPEHAGVLAAVSDLNSVYKRTPALWERDDDPTAFEWIEANEATMNTFSWLRWDASGGCVAVAVNLSPVPRIDHRIGLPFSGTWQEIFNSDAQQYGGTGMGNLGEVVASDVPMNGREFSAAVVLPPLAAVFFEYRPENN
jgi:1,4-alpha-glucan branching enzyme